MTESQDQTMDVIVTDDSQAQNLDNATYGGCEGPDSMYLKLIAKDGYEFYIKREHAYESQTIRMMACHPVPYAETEANVVHLEKIPSHVLQRICQYFAYRMKYKDCDTEAPEFYISDEIAQDVLWASDFLIC